MRGSNTDFNNNARGIQGGTGFATNVNGVDKTALVFNHGPTRGHQRFAGCHERVGGHGARAHHAGDRGEYRGHGRAVFTANCASCHGGAKWTKSRTKGLYQDNPLLAADPVGPAFFTGVAMNDAGVAVAGPQVVSVTRAGKPTLLTILDNVGTFNPASPIEIRGAAAVAGQTTQGFTPFGLGGFNSPSLLGVAYSGPYFHDGSAHTLEEVAARHNLGAAGSDRDQPGCAGSRRPARVRAAASTTPRRRCQMPPTNSSGKWKSRAAREVQTGCGFQSGKLSDRCRCSRSTS